MSVIDSSRAKPALAAGWLVFAILNAWLMFRLPGEETIPYHLIWASFALLYGLFRWSLRTTWVSFACTTIVTGIALIEHARAEVIGWEECSETILMGVLVALLIWHVRRYQAAQHQLDQLWKTERQHSEQREIAARFGSHEVRTRLTIARGFTELIRNRTEDPSVALDADVVMAELDKASALATMLLTLVRVESPSPRLPVDLEELLKRIVNRWSATAERDWGAEVGVHMMLGDAERLESALDCLIENAVKFTSPGDAVTVRASADDDAVILQVIDTGVGIPVDERDEVREIFRTGRNAGARAGSGLGLAIVGAIVESRGGSLDIRSGEHSGTVITMRIPGAHPTGDARNSCATTANEIDTELVG
jgi:signal transduction histidine kinase